MTGNALNKLTVASPEISGVTATAQLSCTGKMKSEDSFTPKGVMLTFASLPWRWSPFGLKV